MGSPSEFWPNLGKTNEDFESTCSVDNVATQVLDTFGIPHNNFQSGAITNLDIKHMDAMQVIKLALAEYSADNGGIWEPAVDEEGEVYAFNVGSFNGLPSYKIYNTIQTFSYITKKAGVMITAAKAPTIRKPIEWKNMLAETAFEIFNTSWMSNGCNTEAYSRHYTIVYNDPHLTEGTESWMNGIDDFYENASPWENIAGYARFIDWPDRQNSPDTTIEFLASAKVPILADGSPIKGTEYSANLGKLQRRPPHPVGITGVSPSCFEGMVEGVVNPDDGIKVTIPSKFRYVNVRGDVLDKFVDINRVFIVGKEVKYRWRPIQKSDAVLSTIPTGSCRVELYIESTIDMVYELEKGKDYQLAYKEAGYFTDPYIVFANNSHPDDPTTYGKDTPFTLNPFCKAYLKAGQGQYLGSLLPHDSTTAYLIQQVFAEVGLNTPSIMIFDPRQGKAKEIADNFQYMLSPIVFVDEPAPVAFNGQLLDLSQMEADHDPTTAQDFIHTDFESAFDVLDGGAGLNLSMSFLEAEQARKLSQELYDLMLSDNGSITVYVCSPDSEPQLGGYGPDSSSVVNEINYSYSDSSSYTISVACGPKIIGDFASISSGPSYKKTEDSVTAVGTITEDSGNHVNFKVMLMNGMGSVNAINTMAEILRVGDQVTCSMHNNPAEV